MRLSSVIILNTSAVVSSSCVIRHKCGLLLLEGLFEVILDVSTTATALFVAESIPCY